MELGPPSPPYMLSEQRSLEPKWVRIEFGNQKPLKVNLSRLSMKSPADTWWSLEILDGPWVLPRLRVRKSSSLHLRLPSNGIN